MEKVRWGVIGAGGIADRRTIPGMQKARFAELVAVMSRTRESTDRVAEKYRVPKRYYSEEDLLADPEVEAVYIATPVYLHRPQTVAAAQAGKHILLEKPLARNASEAEEIVQAVRDIGVKAIEGYMMKFHPLHKRAKELIEEGRLGRPVLGRTQLSCWYPDIPGTWRQDPEQGGGGSLIDMATHCYDLLRWFLGRIVQVAAFVNTQIFQYPVEDSATTLLLFEGGAHGMVDTFFNIPDAAGKDRLELYGDRGSLLAEGTIGQTGGGEMTAYLSKEVRPYDPLQDKAPPDLLVEPVQAEPADLYAAEVDYLSQCILEDREPEINTLEDGLGIIRVVEAAYESARTGRAVEV